MSALIMASPTVFTLVKLLGAAYLVYLGIKMFMQKQQGMQNDFSASDGGFYKAFKQGLITNVLNPKVALFFLAFLPQFIAPHAGSPFIGFIALGLTFVVTSTLWGFVLAWSSAAMSKKMRETPRYLNYLNKFTGTLLVALGVRLVLEK